MANRRATQVPDLPHDGDVGRHAEEAGHEPAWSPTRDGLGRGAVYRRAMSEDTAPREGRHARHAGRDLVPSDAGAHGGREGTDGAQPTLGSRPRRAVAAVNPRACGTRTATLAAPAAAWTRRGRHDPDRHHRTREVAAEAEERIVWCEDLRRLRRRYVRELVVTSASRSGAVRVPAGPLIAYAVLRPGAPPTCGDRHWLRRAWYLKPSDRGEHDETSVRVPAEAVVPQLVPSHVNEATT